MTGTANGEHVTSMRGKPPEWRKIAFVRTDRIKRADYAEIIIAPHDRRPTAANLNEFHGSTHTRPHANIVRNHPRDGHFSVPGSSTNAICDQKGDAEGPLSLIRIGRSHNVIIVAG